MFGRTLIRRFVPRKSQTKSCRFSSTSAETTSRVPPPATPGPVVPKEPLVQRWKRFWSMLYSDYKDVAIDTVNGMRENPKKATKYLTGLGCVWYMLETNPESRTYYSTLLQCADEAILVSEANLNPAADQRLTFLRQSYNEGTIRCLNLGLFSLIWLGNYHKDCGIYPSQCEYLEPGILNFHKRVIDVGFLGRWWNINRYMVDFDINPKEFPV